jgi:peroxiredoxin
LRGILPAIHDAGAQLVIVGNGTPEMARAFVEEMGLTTPVYTDPSRRSYELAGLKRGVLATLSPRGIAHARRAKKGGFKQTAVRGDPWQLGGVLVVEAGGRIAYAHREREAGDLAPVDDVRAAAQAAAGRR